MTKITVDKELIEQAIEALPDVFGMAHFPLRLKLRAALEEVPVVEPVAWVLSHSLGIEFSSKYPMQKSRDAAEQMARHHMGAMTVTPLYASPPAEVPVTGPLFAAPPPPPPNRPPPPEPQWQISTEDFNSRNTRGLKW